MKEVTRMGEFAALRVRARRRRGGGMRSPAGKRTRTRMCSCAHLAHSRAEARICHAALLVSKRRLRLAHLPLFMLSLETLVPLVTR
jgi:hypothetical protein